MIHTQPHSSLPPQNKSQNITVVLLPVSLPQLKDPINGIFREGLELAYNGVRPSHADELREMVQDPNSKTEIVFFLDAYDGGLGKAWMLGVARFIHCSSPAGPSPTPVTDPSFLPLIQSCHPRRYGRTSGARTTSSSSALWPRPKMSKVHRRRSRKCLSP